jgi:hypothetical protein
MNDLSDRELATVLFALRNMVSLVETADSWRELGTQEHFAEHDPLTAEQIDALCKRLNATSPAGWDPRVVFDNQLWMQVDGDGDGIMLVNQAGERRTPNPTQEPVFFLDLAQRVAAKESFASTTRPDVVAGEIGTIGVRVGPKYPVTFDRVVIHLTAQDLLDHCAFLQEQP